MPVDTPFATPAETQVNPDLLFLTSTSLPTDLAPNGSESYGPLLQSSTLGSFDLLAFAEGGKGASSDHWQQIVRAWQEFRASGAPASSKSPADGWSLASNVVRDATDGAEAIVGPMLRFTGTDSLQLPDMQWRTIGKQMGQVSYGAVETTWTGTALAEMRDRFQLAFQEALSPWLPGETPAMNEGLPMLEGLRSTWQGVGTLLPARQQRPAITGHGRGRLSQSAQRH